MKKLIFILFVFTMTVFVACDKGGSGSSDNSNCANNNNATNFGATPVSGNARLYGTSPVYNTGCPYVGPNGIMPNGAFPTIPGCTIPQMQNQYQFCQWLAVSGEVTCNPQAVRELFMNYCSSFAVTFNYCTKGLLARASYVSHYTSRYDNDISDSEYEDIVNHASSSRHSGEGAVTSSQEIAPEPAPAQVSNVVIDEQSHTKVIVKKANCHISLSSCMRVHPAIGRLNDRYRIYDLDTQEKFMKEVARKNIKCWDNDQKKYLLYPEFAELFEAKNCPSQDEAQPSASVTNAEPLPTSAPTTVVTQPETQPTAQEPAQTFPLNPSAPTTISVIAPAATKKNGCLRADGSTIAPSKIVDLQHIHEMLMVPGEHSYMRKYISLPLVKDLNSSDKEALTLQAYNLPMGSTSTDIAEGVKGTSNTNFSALGLKVLQSDEQMTLDIGDQHGEIYQCDSNLNYIRVHFLDTKNNIRYDAKISKDIGSTDIKGSLRIEILGTAKAASREIPYQTISFMNWNTEKNISKLSIKNKKNASLLEKMQLMNKKIAEDIYNDPTQKKQKPNEGYQRLLNNTLDIISTK